MPTKYIEKILRAKVYDVARESPLEPAPLLSKRLDNQVLLKREDMQSVFSFKLRGAYNKIANLPEAERGRGVIAASAGNHAQGVALAAQHLGIPALIVMPKTTPPIKVQAVRNRGAKAVLFGDSYDEAYEHALALCQARDLSFIHPFDDPEVIAAALHQIALADRLTGQPRAAAERYREVEAISLLIEKRTSAGGADGVHVEIVHQPVLK